MKSKSSSHRKRRHPARRDLKDRLIQTRVPGDLESVLKKEASRRRLSVSHLVRNVLEDTFDLVDGVVADVDTIVQDSMGLANRVRRNAGRIASRAVGSAPAREVAEEPFDEEYGDEAREEPPRGKAARTRAESEPDPMPEPTGSGSAADLDHILAWNAVIMNRDGQCAGCGIALQKGDAGHLGISRDPTAGPTWLCDRCVASL